MPTTEFTAVIQFSRGVGRTVDEAGAERSLRRCMQATALPFALARAAIADGRPLLGICLGHQIIGCAAGANTRRLPFGHYAANHPVKDLETGLVQVTSQNHEVTVVGETLPAASGFVVSQIDLNDGSVEGLRDRTLPIETVQYHPEGGPGPLDALAVFDRFVSAARVTAAPSPSRRWVRPSRSTSTRPSFSDGSRVWTERVPEVTAADARRR
jgi:GMP synthase-like glutamine amidotransferase